MNIKIKDPWSALTHFIGMILALFATAPLLVKAAFSGEIMHVYAMAVFMIVQSTKKIKELRKENGKQ